MRLRITNKSTSWAHAMHARFGGLIAVALELSKGPIVWRWLPAYR
jgi:hypothetical protein